jgi:hypothetical protein
MKYTASTQESSAPATGEREAQSQERRSSSQDDFWSTFRLVPWRLEANGLKYWYVLLVGFCLIVLILDALHDLHRGIFYKRSLLEYDVTNWFLLSEVTIIAATAWTFTLWLEHIPTIFQFVVKGRRIISLQPNEDVSQKYKQFLQEYQRILLSSQRMWMIILLTTLALVFSLVLLLPGLPLIVSSFPRDPLYSLLRVLSALLAVLIPLPLCAYFFAVGAWIVYSTGSTLRKVTKSFELVVVPNHPDGCGGLKWLGNFCLGMALPLLLSLSFLGVWGIGGALTVGVTPAIIAVNSILFFGIILSILAFFVPLWGIHQQMLSKEEAYENEFVEQTGKLEQTMRSALLVEKNIQKAKEAKEEWDMTQVIYANTRDYPVWPFDRGILLKFLTPQIVPILSLVVGISPPAAEALKSILSIISGK